jgi:membrane protein
VRISFKQTKDLIMEAAREWSDDKASRLGAALAYYTVFSIAPLLVITLAVVGFFLGDEAAYGGITDQLDEFMGPKGAEAIEGMIQNASQERSAGIFATVISTALLLFGASGVFVQLKDALNTVWDVPPKKIEGGIKAFIKNRFLSFGFVLGVGFLLLVSLVISTIISGIGNYMSGAVPMGPLLQVVNLAISLGVITVLFAMIFKFLPDVELPWKDVWLGAAVTALLFTIGKFALGQYLGRSSMSSTYGAAGSFVVLLVWIYYSAQIAFFGAELTQVYSRTYGSCKGRVKRTEKEKSGHFPDREKKHFPFEGSPDHSPGLPHSTGAETAHIPGEEPGASADAQASGMEKANPVGKAIGKAAGIAVATQAAASGLKDKKKN